MSLLVLCIALLCVVLVIAGVNGGSEPDDEDLVLVTGGDPPKIEVDEKATPPEKLLIEDVKEGDGPEAKEGDEIAVHFAGVDWTGKATQSSWDGASAEPFSFTLGASPPEASSGWEQGIPGMKVGGRRELIIPPKLLYPPDEIPERELRPDETQVYVVDLVKVGSG